MRYYISDLHFYHENLLHKMDCRQFNSIDEMNEYMIMKWNNKVRPSDDVVILGDISWGTPAQTNEILDKLNGFLYLISGNHDHFDTDKRLNRERFKWIKPYEEMKDEKRKVILCHYPIIFYNGQYNLDKDGNPKTYMLYGHVHNTADERLITQFQNITRSTQAIDASGSARNIPCNLINCFCGFSDYEPLSLTEWIECDRRRREERLFDAKGNFI